ncbi:TPA: hypothetical protein I9786_002814 [Serratia marcescens]|nr:hypothetical protein [Serratia marcescens]HAT5031478.1 hypothetical protein [Serratia marcescens]
MSTEKLSELSKPTACRNKHTGRTFNATENTEPQIYESLYSQEYVSALIQRAERIDSMLTESVQALKVAEQRIAELEGQLQSGFTPEALAQEERAENAEQRVAELEVEAKVWESAALSGWLR